VQIALRAETFGDFLAELVVLGQTKKDSNFQNNLRKLVSFINDGCSSSTGGETASTIPEQKQQTTVKDESAVGESTPSIGSADNEGNNIDIQARPTQEKIHAICIALVKTKRFYVWSHCE